MASLISCAKLLLKHVTRPSSDVTPSPGSTVSEIVKSGSLSSKLQLFLGPFPELMVSSPCDPSALLPLFKSALSLCSLSYAHQMILGSKVPSPVSRVASLLPTMKFPRRSCPELGPPWSGARAGSQCDTASARASRGVPSGRPIFKSHPHPEVTVLTQRVAESLPSAPCRGWIESSG